MWLESIDILEVILEGVKAVGIWFLVAVIWRAGNRFPELSNASWQIPLESVIQKLTA